MGVDLGDLFERRKVELEDLLGQRVAIDAYNTLYQFLSIIRQRDGTPLKDSRGNVTSHLSGILYRTTNLLEAGVRPIYVFDGEPPDFKAETIETRREARREAEKRWEAAETEEEARRWAQASARLTTQMAGESKQLILAMGLPVVQAPGEGEAQAAHMVQRGDADMAGSQDYDSLLFGAPRVVRNLTVTGRRKLPGKNVYVNVTPEIIELERALDQHEITRRQLVEIGILVGTDYNEGVKGVGPKTALKLIKEHGGLQGALRDIDEEIPNYQAIREYFLSPPTTDDYEVRWRAPDPDEVTEILVGEHDFSHDRVEKALARVEESIGAEQMRLDQWF